jgi:glc operon protein GlcG
MPGHPSRNSEGDSVPRLRFVLSMAALLAAGSAAAADSKPVLSLDDAKRAAAGAAAEAKRVGAPSGAIAVVDDGGHLLYLERLDDTFPAAATVATDKARTAAEFRKPTADFEKAVNGGRTAFLGNREATPLQGGIPLVRDGQVVGAIGVSGAANAEQDTKLAAAGAALPALATAPAQVVLQLDAAEVKSAFAKGAPLAENGLYKIHASRRDAPGQAEVHTRDTDIVYVLEGTASLVTGGSVVGPEEIAPGEIRGARIEGGVARELAPGQVVVVPNGTPHWFERVPGPFVYYVVKVTVQE